jgi:hypothetical protein
MWSAVIDVFWFGALFFFAFGLARLPECLGRTV